MNPITNLWNWLKTFNASTHFFAMAGVALVLAFKGYSPFHDLVMQVYAWTPGYVQTLIGTGLFLAALYKSGALQVGSVKTTVKTVKTPGDTSSSTTRLGVMALIALLLSGTLAGSMTLTGCTQAQRISVAQEIVNWTPVFIATADTVNSAVMALDPATIIVLAPLTAGINAFGPQIQLAAQNYLANPNQTTLQVLQSLVTQIQQQVNATLLAAAKIVNPNSQATAIKNVNLIATVASAILALVQSITPKVNLVAMANNSPIKFAQVRPYMDEGAMRVAGLRVARDLQLVETPTPARFFALEAQAGF